MSALERRMELARRIALARHCMVVAWRDGDLEAVRLLSEEFGQLVKEKADMTIVLEPVESTNIARVGYDADKKELHVRFRSGALYAYDEVPPELHAALMAADSKGRFLNAEVKGKHAHRRIE